MTINTIPARIFHNAIVQMGHHDRFARKAISTNFIPISCDANGYRLRNEDDGKHEIFMSHQEIYDELDGGVSEVVYGWNCPEMSRLRILFGDMPFEKFPIERQNLASYREKLIDRWDDHLADLGKNPRLSTAEMQQWLNEQDGELFKEAMRTAKGATDGKSRANKQIKLSWFDVPSVKTFQRDYKKYHAADCNRLALIHRHHGPGQRFFRADADSIAFAVDKARGFLSRLRPKYSAVFRDYLAALHVENRNRTRKLAPVSRKKFVALIKKFDEFDTVAARHGYQAAVRKFMKIRRQFDILRPGQRIEIDHMKVDLITLLSEIGALTTLPDWVVEKLKEADMLHQRIHVVAAIDVATRYILAFKASTNPKAASAVAALRMIMSDKRWLSEYVGARTPWIGRIWPEETYMDNGTEFTADRTETVFRTAQIAYTRPAAGDPQRRPFVESLFHTVGPLLTSYFDGKTFNSIAEKGDYDAAAHVSIDVDELIKVFLFAILDVYHNRPHAGLGGNTPHNAWVQGTQEHRIKFPPSSAGLARIFGVAANRKIQVYGVSNMGIPYSNDTLQAQRRTHGQDVEIMYDPECAEFILAKGETEWYPVRNTIGLDGTVTLHEWAAALKSEKQRNAENAVEGLAVMYEAIDRIRRIGEAATLRANLSHVVPSDADFEKLHGQLDGAWVEAPVRVVPQLENALVLRSDPLRGGDVAVGQAVGADSAVVSKLFEAYGVKTPAPAPEPVSSFVNDEDQWK
ncbi:transposase [Rhizobium deserti]|uniref:Transposase n=1 Tax=Rhizobium deserti TaxID=2547961 RepID=A0A4R5U9I4_9HYPH|nr:DDE-type integrase/transposase/recombinase [Rhizobium deserti]TDK31290.1 transposase [Rhizobium deserti]